MNEEQRTIPEEAHLVLALDGDQFERFVRLRALELGRSAPPPPSTFGRDIMWDSLWALSFS